MQRIQIASVVKQRQQPTVEEGGSSGASSTAAPSGGVATALQAFGANTATVPHLSWLQQLQLKVWVLFDDPSSSAAARIVSIAMMLVIAVSVTAFCLGSIPNCWWANDADNANAIDVAGGGKIRQCNERVEGDCVLDQPLEVIEAICIVVFSLEYLLRLFASPAACGYFKFITGTMNLIDLVAIVPWYIDLLLCEFGTGGGAKALAVLRVIRLTRVIRVFKVSRNFTGIIILARTMQRSLSALLMLFFFIGISMILFSTLIFFAEKGQFDSDKRQFIREDGSVSPFESIPGSFWWCLVTMTTVGYGDHYPVTFQGKLVGILTMFIGLVVLSLPITIIGANFDEEYREVRRVKENAELASKAALAPSRDSGASTANDAVVQVQKIMQEAHTQILAETEAIVKKHEAQVKLKISKVMVDYARRKASKKDAPMGTTSDGSNSQ